LIEARGLPKSDSGYQVVMQTENQRSNSEVAKSNAGEPMWSEILTFDIQTGRDPIFIEIRDGKG
jgi:hypothetical protein